MARRRVWRLPKGIRVLLVFVAVIIWMAAMKAWRLSDYTRLARRGRPLTGQVVFVQAVPDKGVDERGRPYWLVVTTQYRDPTGKFHRLSEYWTFLGHESVQPGTDVSIRYLPSNLFVKAATSEHWRVEAAQRPRRPARRPVR